MSSMVRAFALCVLRDMMPIACCIVQSVMRSLTPVSIKPPCSNAAQDSEVMQPDIEMRLRCEDTIDPCLVHGCKMFQF